VTPDQLKAGQLNLSAIPAGFVISECPYPFLKDPLAVEGSDATTDATYCRYGCCIPCPAQNLVSFFLFVSSLFSIFTHVHYDTVL
jgi:hypothetical protein